MRNKIDRFLYKYLEVNLVFLLIFITVIAMIYGVFYLIGIPVYGGYPINFLCLIAGIILEKAIVVYIKKRRREVQ